LLWRENGDKLCLLTRWVSPPSSVSVSLMNKYARRGFKDLDYRLPDGLAGFAKKVKDPQVDYPHGWRLESHSRFRGDRPIDSHWKKH
jgi:hypothetical protein